MESDLYSRQMKWREDAKKKALETRSTNQEDPECTFEPKKYTKSSQKKFTGTAMEKGISSHVVRQAKARQNLNKKESPIKNSSSKISSLLPVEAVRESDTNRTHMERRGMSSPPSSPEVRAGAGAGGPAAGANSAANCNGVQETIRMDGLDFTDETVVDMLERERREWQSDRVKLIHCIHLQQLELTQRAVASHEKATDIAKEFARAIEGFEERLVSVENNVHKEISAIKKIAETLLLSSNLKNQQNGEGDLSVAEARVVRLENCMEGILDRLDNITTSIASNKKELVGK